MAPPKQVAIIGAALDLGSGRRGVDMGPSAIRYAGIEERLTGIGYSCLDWGNVETAVLEATEEQDERARYLPQILAACGQVAGLVQARAHKRVRDRPVSEAQLPPAAWQPRVSGAVLPTE